MVKPYLGALLLMAAAAGAERDLTAVFEGEGPPAARGRIDELVFTRLRELGITPANLCSDAVFARRASLDLTGTLPTVEEAARFLDDADPNKRAALVDRLLERPEFADYQAMKWSDLLRVKAEFPINLWPNAAQAYYRWIYTSIRDHKPYARFARELLTGSGSNFRDPAVNFYRAVENREPRAVAQTVALVFMGTRAEKWPAERLDAMAAFFSQIGYKETGEWKEEIVLFDPAKKDARRPSVFPDGTPVPAAPDRDPRELFADWLTSARNPWFARAMANRAWCWLLGRGIVHEPDDIRPDNPPANPALLAYLEQELIASRYDLKHLYRLILNSATYQLSPIPKSDHPAAAAQFACYPVRRLEAEVLIDALCQISGTSESYASAIPEPFTQIPEGRRSIALPDGSISSSFLELFGRPPRDTGLDSERNNRASAAQRLYLLNSSHVQRKIARIPRMPYVAANAGNPRAAITGVYLAVLGRRPTGAELRAVADYSRSGGAQRREAVMDLAWALINSAEFLYRH